MKWLAAVWLLWSLQAPQEPAHLVIDAKTQAPVAFARVLFARTDAPLGQSVVVEADARGHFKTDAVPAGTYRVFAEHDDYMRGSRAEPLSIRAGEAVPAMSIALTPTAVIAGRISNETGEPAVKVYVRAYRVTPAGPSADVSAEARTNDLGEYRLFGLEPGAYIVTAQPYTAPSIGTVETPGGRGPTTPQYIVPTPPCPDCRGEGRGMQAITQLTGAGAYIHPFALTGQSYPRVYFPGSIDAAQAKPVTVDAGARLDGIDMRLILKNGGPGL
jgi:hypothetical protein